MWVLLAATAGLLGALSPGSAQLIVSGTDVIEENECNETIVLPCHVVNLRQNNENVMLVTWKKEGKVIFSFRGGKNEFFKDPAFSSAKLAFQDDLIHGVASLQLDTAEATVGNYSCEIIESNREGLTRMELRQGPVVSCDDENTTPKEKCGSWFLLMERAIIISLLFLVIILCGAQFTVVALKYEIESRTKVCIIVAVVILAILAGVGTALFVQDGYTADNQAGLGLIVVPAVIFIPLQYYMFGIVFDSLPQATLALIGLKILGYIIAVVGFALCVTACPPSHGSVLIAGLAIMPIASLLSLAYVLIMGSRMKDHPRPGKAVEEPLNELKSYVMREQNVHRC